MDLRLAGRIAAVVAVTAVVLLCAPLLPVLPPRARRSWQQACCRAVLAAVGVRVEVVGPRRFGDGVLVVANHVSWVEVLALSAVQPVRMVAKSEIRNWPGIGAVATALGSIFVDRSRLRLLPEGVAAIGRTLAAGHAVGVFPEGTTWCGAAAGTFHRAAFQAAIDAGAPVCPVAVTLRTPDGRAARSASFVGDQTLLAGLHRVLRLPGLVCELTVLPVLAPDDDRAGLARRAALMIGAVTGVPHGPARREDLPAAA